MTSILAASEPASKNTSEYVGFIVNGGKEPKLKNDKNSRMVTYQISAMSAILEEAPTKQKTETDSKSSKQQNNKHEESEQPDKPHLRTS